VVLCAADVDVRGESLYKKLISPYLLCQIYCSSFEIYITVSVILEQDAT